MDLVSKQEKRAPFGALDFYRSDLSKRSDL